MLRKIEILELPYLVSVNITKIYDQKRCSKTNVYDVLSLFDKGDTVTIFRNVAFH